jgi:long-chain acyl-CoA synthetase
MNLTEPILRHARMQPNAIALIERDQAITYAELSDRVLRTASHLAKFGIARGDQVGLCLKDDSQHIVALLAVTRLGAIAVQIDIRSRPTERSRVVDAFQLQFALVSPESEAGINCPKVTLDAAWHAAVSAADQTVSTVQDWCAPFAVLASSGTTGLPKFTIATHLQYYFHIASYLEILPPRRHRYLSCLPLYFSSGRIACLSHLLRGDTVILAHILFSPDEFIKNIFRHKITVARVAPSVLRQLLPIANGRAPVLPDLDLLVATGSPLFADEKREIGQRVSPRFCEMYGAAAIGPIAASRSEEISTRPASVGRSLSLVDVEIVDDNDQPLDIGATGQLRCRGPSLTSPITTLPEANSVDFRNGWYYPGELGTLDEFGYIFLKGRTSEVIFRSGAKIFPSEVELVLQEHDGVAEAAVVGRALSNNEQEPVAYVVPKRPLTSGELLAHCRTRLTSFKVPRQIHFVTELPRNSSGKIDKRELAKENPRETLTDPADLSAPRSPTNRYE